MVREIPQVFTLNSFTMKNQLLGWSALLLLFLASCEKSEIPNTTAVDHFITKDLTFLYQDLSSKGAKAWPANGCKEIDVKLKIPLFGEYSSKFYHCCINYACNLVALSEVVNFFLRDKNKNIPKELEVLSSERINFNKYEFRIRPGIYTLDVKTKSLPDLEYEVWVYDR